MKKVYIVVSVDPCGYDSWDKSHHLTRKGALLAIMQSKYNDWDKFRYIPTGGYEDEHMYVVERNLYE